MSNQSVTPEFEWNDIYTGTVSDYVEPDAQLLSIIDTLEPGRVLDVGCGAGGLVAAMAERGWHCSGIDIAPRAIEAAKHVLASRGLGAELTAVDAATWHPARTYDLVTNSFALPTSQADQAQLFTAIREALAPGATLLIKDFDSSMRRHEEFAPYHCPSVEELLAAFDGFEILRADVVETPAHSHHGSAGKSDLRWTAALLHARAPRLGSGD